MLKKYQAKQGQDQRTFISAFLCVFTTIAKNLFSEESLQMHLVTCVQIQLSNLPSFSSFREVLSLNTNKARLFEDSLTLGTGSI